MTQPTMYALIDQKPSARKLYIDAGVERGDLTEEETEGLVRNVQEHLDEAVAATRSSSEADPRDSVQGLDLPQSQQGAPAGAIEETAVDHSVLERIGQAHGDVPDSFTVHPKLKKVINRRQQMSSEGGIDWAYGELLRSEEHTSELQSRGHLVCRLLLEK